MPDSRTLFVPDGLDGERVDAALARLFGVSRTKAAELAASGHVQVNHSSAGKSDRVSAGDLLEVALPSPQESPSVAVIAGLPARLVWPLNWRANGGPNSSDSQSDAWKGVEGVAVLPPAEVRTLVTFDGSQLVGLIVKSDRSISTRTLR